MSLPDCLPNRSFVYAYHLLSIMTGFIPEVIIRRHREENRKKFPALFFGQGYIEDQIKWQAIRFGTHPRSNLCYSGCGIIAAWNACFALRLLPDWTMAELIAQFEKKGSVLWGGFGISPLAICRFFRNQHKAVALTYTEKQEPLDRFGNEHDVYIATVWNDRKHSRSGLHTVCITKEKDGFVAHNIYRKGSNGKWIPAEASPTLSQAVNCISKAPKPVVVLGMSRQEH